MKRVGTAEMPIVAEPKVWKGFRNWGIAALMSFATASHLRAVAVLAVISIASFLPGFFQIPPVDRDEARFAQATKQMIETDDYIDIRFQDEARYKKPVGIYWLQAAVVEMAEAVGDPNARTKSTSRSHGSRSSEQFAPSVPISDEGVTTAIFISRPACSTGTRESRRPDSTAGLH